MLGFIYLKNSIAVRELILMAFIGDLIFYWISKIFEQTPIELTESFQCICVHTFDPSGYTRMYCYFSFSPNY